MGRVLSLSFWLQVILATLFTMIMIYVIKKALGKVEVPVLSQVAAGV